MAAFEALSRRGFLHKIGATAASASAMLRASSAGSPQQVESPCAETLRESLDGAWVFKVDPNSEGDSQGWFQGADPSEGWKAVTVPHTWQIGAETSEYLGVA